MGEGRYSHPMPTRAGRALAGLEARAVEAVVFDFNGTLSHDEPVLLRIFTDLFRKHLGWEMTPGEYFTRLAGHSDREIVETAVAERAGGDPELVTRLLRARGHRYREIVAHQPTVLAGTRALVEALTRISVPLAVVTGAQRADVECVLTTTGLAGRFAAVVCAEDVRHGKPRPEGLLRAADTLGIRPQRRDRVVVFEDSIAGVQAARAAGMRCVAVAGTTEPAVLAAQADAVVDRLDTHALDLLGLASRTAEPRHW